MFHSGSVIQHDYTTTDNGISVIDVELTSKRIIYTNKTMIPNEYGFSKLEVNNNTCPILDFPFRKINTLRLDISNSSYDYIDHLINDLKQRYTIQNIEQINKSNSIVNIMEGIVQTNIKSLDVQDELIRSMFKSPEISQNVIELHHKYFSEIQIPQSHNIPRWHLMKLEFDNLYCFGQGNVIDFTKLENSITGVIAPNQAGKSSIINILLFAMYGVINKGTIKNLVNNKNEVGCAKVFFEINGHPYWIKRVVKKGKIYTERSSEVDIGENSNITNTIVALQDDYDSFIRMKPKDRKSFLIELFNIHLFDELFEKVSLDRKELKGKIDLLKSQLQIKKKKEFENIKDVLSNEVQKLKEQRDVINEKLKQLKQTDKLMNNETFNSDVSQYEVDFLREHELYQKGTDKLMIQYHDIKQRIDTQAEIKYKQFVALNSSKFNEKTYKENQLFLTKNVDWYVGERVVPCQFDKKKLDELEKIVGDKDIAKHASKLAKIKFSIEDLSKKLFPAVLPQVGIGHKPNIDHTQMSIKLKMLLGKQAFLKDRTGQLRLLKVQMPNENEVKLEMILNQVFGISPTDTNESVDREIRVAQDQLHAYEFYSNRETEEQISILKDAMTKAQLYDTSVRELEEMKKQEKIYNNNLYLQAKGYVEDYDIYQRGIQEMEKKLNELKTFQLLTKVITLKLRDGGNTTNLRDEIETLNWEKFKNQSEIERAMEKLIQLRDCRNILSGYNLINQYYKILNPKERESIPFRLLSRFTDEFVKYINDILRTFAKYTIKITKDFEIYLDNDIPIIQASGGQRFIISILVRMALAEISHMIIPDMIMIDEGFGSLDENNVSNIITFVKSIKERFRLTFIVSHMELLHSIIDNPLTISQVDNLSFVSNAYRGLVSLEPEFVPKRELPVDMNDFILNEESKKYHCKFCDKEYDKNKLSKHFNSKKHQSNRSSN
ncbi:DNA double-strand break repair Rad50 ATPase [uncultured archaeon]|nr:DNA double-strand break repair Rad50 ATPase [uncultured archaeon]